MSTSATATARGPDDQPRFNRWLKYIGEEDGSPSGNTIPIERPTTGPSVSFDLARVERLVGQMEARSMALVRYGYAEHSQPSHQPSSNIVIISTLAALWFSTLALSVAYIHFNSLTPPQSANQKRVSNKLVVPPMPHPEQKLATSVDQLAKAFTFSSPRLKRLEAAGGRSKADPQKIRGPAVAHQAADGTVDYWVLPPGPYHNSPTKVFSVGKAENGVVVRNLEDRRYYIVTPSGSWHRIPLTPSGNLR